MQRPFEADRTYLREHLDEMVRVTISDLSSEFLLMPKGGSYIEFPDFRDALEVLKRHTQNFTAFSQTTVDQAIRENSQVFVVLRAILGMTLPEWADLARTELGSDVGQGAARNLDKSCRTNARYVAEIEHRYADRLRKRCDPSLIPRPKSLARIAALVAIAVRYIAQGAPADIDGVVHRLAKFDTHQGLGSLRYASTESVPYPVLRYERYLGRPFAGHRDAESELVGEVMENAIEERLRAAAITYRKTKRAERIPGFDQAPDFCVPDEVSPVVVIEAKITSDDGTARDKVTRIKNLVTQRNDQVAGGRFRPYEVVACVDGRGFRQRREDMRQLLLALDGKVFTTATLDDLIANTRLREFVTSPNR
ncbi:MAG: hypothetical protein ACRDJW_19760 [Thermomicrobiales bacterium]